MGESRQRDSGMLKGGWTKQQGTPGVISWELGKPLPRTITLIRPRFLTGFSPCDVFPITGVVGFLTGFSLAMSFPITGVVGFLIGFFLAMSFRSTGVVGFFASSAIVSLLSAAASIASTFVTVFEGSRRAGPGSPSRGVINCQHPPVSLLVHGLSTTAYSTECTLRDICTSASSRLPVSRFRGNLALSEPL